MMAEERYKELREELLQNLERLKMKLDKHQEEFISDNKNWGFVGDLSLWSEKLKEIVKG